MTKCISFHSYKGGTGKTTIASNLAAMLVTRGFKVSLLDLDVYAPSLHAYFDCTPNKWINDFLNGHVPPDDVITDGMPMLEKITNGQAVKSGGEFWLGFSNPQKEEIIKLEGQGKQTSANVQALKRLIELREILISEYDCDYIIIDTSPGLRYWSINALAISDILLLALKFDKLDIVGTRKMTVDIYASLKKLGAKPYLLLNRTNGYCRPESGDWHGQSQMFIPQQDAHEVCNKLLQDTGMEVISTIPCYCDIQFSTAEFLTAVRYPDHPFARQLEAIVTSEQLLSARE